MPARIRVCSSESGGAWALAAAARATKTSAREYIGPFHSADARAAFDRSLTLHSWDCGHVLTFDPHVRNRNRLGRKYSIDVIETQSKQRYKNVWKRLGETHVLPRA